MQFNIIIHLNIVNYDIVIKKSFYAVYFVLFFIDQFIVKLKLFLY